MTVKLSPARVGVGNLEILYEQNSFIKRLSWCSPTLLFIGWILILKGRIFILWKLQRQMLGQILSFFFFLKMWGRGVGGEKELNDQKDKRTVGLANINWNYLYNNSHEEYMWSGGCLWLYYCGQFADARLFVSNILCLSVTKLITCINLVGCYVLGSNNYLQRVVSGTWNWILHLESFFFKLKFINKFKIN